MEKWNRIIQGDSILELPNLLDNSVHCILSDIPYGIGKENWDVLHENGNSAYLGSSPAQKTAGAIFQKRGKPLNGWSQSDRLISKQYYDWCMTWSLDWYRVLKPGGSAFVFAGRRFAHRCICAMEDSGFTYKDMLGWSKEKAPHRAQRLSVVYEKRGDIKSAQKWKGWKIGNLRPIFEPILWFTKPYKIGQTIADTVLENEVGAYNEKAFLEYSDFPNNFISSSRISSDFGLHPTQKPLRLTQALIELVTRDSQIVLDPFCGSGTTLVAAKLLNRKFLGIEKEKKFYEIAKKRLEELPS